MKLEARAIEFSYGSVQVLFGVDLSVDDGEMVALLGTNGAGKSTLLAVLAGLIRPSAGSVYLDGSEVTGMDTYELVRRGVVLVEGGRAVFPDLTVEENLMIGLHSLRLRTREARRRAADVMERAPTLRELSRRPAGSLSGGEQQQLAIAKSLLAQPAALLIDELTLGLSPQAREEVMATVRAVNATGTSVVLVEQSLDVASSLCHRALFMEKGAVTYDGPVKSLLRRSDLARAVFLGAPVS